MTLPVALYRVNTELAQAIQGFRHCYYHLASEHSTSVLLDSCGGAQPLTAGYYMLGVGERQRFSVNQNAWNGVNPLQSAQELWKHCDKAQAELMTDPLFQRRMAAYDALALPHAWPFVVGWFGVLGYELNHLLEPTVPYRVDSDTDLLSSQMTWVACEDVAVWDSHSQQVLVLSENPAFHAVIQSWAELGDSPLMSDKVSETVQVWPPSVSMTQVVFETQVRRILGHIAVGDIYQANLSMRFERELMGITPQQLYQALVDLNPSPFSGLFQLDNAVLISNSPERLVKRHLNSAGQPDRLETRPIAGTRGRGATRDAQDEINQTLQQDLKEQAEHLMLLDLERNDIGRVSRPASVTVPEAFALEHYSHVTHMVSQVEGYWDPALPSWALIEALFPGGTITGCPKVRCMEILAQCEPVPRGFYTGSLGYWDVRGSTDWNILIRSMMTQKREEILRIRYHAGAGIVADSNPAYEYRECLRKSQGIESVLDRFISSIASVTPVMTP